MTARRFRPGLRRAGSACRSAAARIGRRSLPYGIVLFLAVAAVAQEPIPVSVEVHPEEITVGGRVDAKLTLVWEGDEPVATPRFPVWQEGWGQAEILEAGEVEAFPDPSGRRVYTQKLVLTAFETGEVTLPRMTVVVPLVEGNADVPTREGVRFTVRSVLPEAAPEGEAAAPAAEDAAGEELEPRPPAPLVDLGGGHSFLLTTAALVLLAAVVAAILLRRLGRVIAEAIAERRLLPPLEELEKNLRGAENDPAEPAATRMSHALRRFLGRGLDFNAVESTTSEIQRRLRELVTPEIGQRAVKLLRDCDQVKFARLEVAPAVTAERVAEVRRLGSEIDELLRPPEEEEEKEEAA